MFWMPVNVNENAARLVGLQVVATCIVIIIFREHDAAWYTAFGMGFDYLLRFVGGTKASLYGVTASWILALFPDRIPVKWTPGAPKQFAAGCGMFMSFFSSLLYFALNDQDDSEVAASIVIGGLLGAAAMESLLNFCLGCWMFGLLVRFGFVDGVVYSHASMHEAEAKYGYDLFNLRLYERARLARTVRSEPPQGSQGSRTLVMYKPKTREMFREQMDLLRGMRLSYFSCPLGLLGLALVWKQTDAVLESERNLHDMREALAWLGFSVYAALLVLQLLQLIVYPRKVWKQVYNHPVESNFLCLVFGNLLLLLALLEGQEDWHHELRHFLFWAAAPAVMLCQLLQVATWVSVPQNIEWLSPTWLVPALCNLFVPMVSPLAYSNSDLATSYSLAGWLWFAAGVFMWVILTPAILYRLFFVPRMLSEMQNSTPLLAAAPAVAVLGYVSIMSALGLSANPGLNTFALVCYFLSAFFFLLNLPMLTWKNFLMQEKWDMSYWAMGFPACAVALALLSLLETLLALDAGLTLIPRQACYIAVGVATFVTAMLAGSTVLALINRRVFNREQKWGPLQLIQLSHFAFEEAGKELVAHAHATAERPAGRVKELLTLLRSLRRAHTLHSAQEDAVLFKAMQELVPGHARPQEEEHVEEREALEQLEAKLETVLTTRGKEAKKELLGMLLPQIVNVVKHLEAHMRGEEENLAPIGRKYFTRTRQTEVARDVYFHTSADDWAWFMPWLLEHTPHNNQRVRLLRAFVWALPERAQLFGKWTQEGMSGLKFDLMAKQVPEIIPRHSDGWTKLY